MMPTRKLTTSNDPKGRKATDIFRAMYDKAELMDGPNESAQFLNENPKFPEEILKVIQECSLDNQYVEQEVKSNYGYLSGYKGAHSINDQISILKKYNWGKEIIWKLNDKQKTLLEQVPNGSEGWFVVPFDKTMISNPLSAGGITNFGEPLEMVLNFLKQSHNGKLANWVKEKLSPKYYRRSERLKKATNELWEMQECSENLILVSAQFGIKHAGRSVNRARVVIHGNEYPIGSYEVGVMLLTHPERLLKFDDLWINCPGDEYSLGGVGDFSKSPYFRFREDELKIDTRDISFMHEHFGSASGFLL